MTGIQGFCLSAPGSSPGRESPPPTFQLPVTLLLNAKEPTLNQGLVPTPTPW